MKKAFQVYEYWTREDLIVQLQDVEKIDTSSVTSRHAPSVSLQKPSDVTKFNFDNSGYSKYQKSST